MQSPEHSIAKEHQAVNSMTGKVWSQESYISAYNFAARAHNGQKVPGTDLPYIVHVTLVSMEVMTALANRNSVNADLAVQCALLHDTIEDTPVTYDLVQDAFGQSVADGVLALTKDKSIAADMADKKERKRSMMQDSLRRIREQPQEVWMVKLADRITNLQTPPHYWDEDKIQRYKQEAVLILDQLRDASDFLAYRLMERIAQYPLP
jgi:(p)ppGpp synthase/HD superfamily hydrolase